MIHSHFKNRSYFLQKFILVLYSKQQRQHFSNCVYFITNLQLRRRFDTSIIVAETRNTSTSTTTTATTTAMTRNNISKVKIPPEGKIYDSDGFWLRAAAVCVRDDSESEVKAHGYRGFEFYKCLQSGSQ